MPRCPSCSRLLPSDNAILRHMNQPASGCHGWVDNLVEIGELLEEEPEGRTWNSPSPVRRSAQAGSSSTPKPFDIPDDRVDDLGPEDPYGDTVEMFPDAAAIYGHQENSFLQQFDRDRFSQHRRANLYYPFASRADWELGFWLTRSGLSMAAIDSLLSLQLMKTLPLSFRTARQLRGLTELLPSGPEWQCRALSTQVPTKSPVRLFYRDPIKCLEALFNHPLFHDKLDLIPRRVYKTAERLVRVYSEWMTGNAAWEMQSKLPVGATLLGVILSSDKTNISALVGDRCAHPLLLGLANIRMSTRLKLSSEAFLLTALLPVPKFIHKSRRIRGLLADRLIHESLDIVLQPLKDAAREGIMMNDPLGNIRYCFTPLASYIVDTPEACMLAGVAGKTSPITTAMYKHFGDAKQHPLRTKSHTLKQLRRIKVNPSDLRRYLAAAQVLRLNGVAFPFFRDWLMASPPRFLTPEPLHEWHKKIWDHVVRWAINILGAEEIDFRYSILQPSVGFRQFKEGISHLKQVTGRIQWDVQRSLVGVIAGCAPAGVVIAVRSLLDFCYLAQAPELDDNDCETLLSSLHDFHKYKSHVIKAGGRRGKKRNIITNWYIPKLELLQNVVPSIRDSGAPSQWTADVTEHAHITMIKNPVRRSNNVDMDPQICRYLDCLEKCSRFELATSLRELQRAVHLDGEDRDECDDDDGVDRLHHPEARINGDSRLFQSIVKLGQPKRLPTNYFTKAHELSTSPPEAHPFPLRCFMGGPTAIYLGRDPKTTREKIDDAAATYHIPDLRAALGDYIRRENSKAPHVVSGPRLSPPDCDLPFTHLAVWHTVRLQQTQLYSSGDLDPARTIVAFPPSAAWKRGRFDPVIFNVDPERKWPQSGLSGHAVGELRLIFRPVPPHAQKPWWSRKFLIYVRRFNIVLRGNHKCDPATSMHVLRRAKRANGEYLGDVIPLDQLRSSANLIPRFGKVADKRLSPANSHAVTEEFWLNKYWDKEFFYALYNESKQPPP